MQKYIFVSLYLIMQLKYYIPVQFRAKHIHNLLLDWLPKLCIFQSVDMEEDNFA